MLRYAPLVQLSWAAAQLCIYVSLWQAIKHITFIVSILNFIKQLTGSIFS